MAMDPCRDLLEMLVGLAFQQGQGQPLGPVQCPDAEMTAAAGQARRRAVS